MEEFIQLFGNLLAFVYHCFDRMVIHGYLSGLSRPEQVVYFVREVLRLPVVSKEVLSQRTGDYRDWVEAYARNHHIPIEWAEKGVRKEDYVSPRRHRLVRKNAYGVYFICKSMEQGRTFRISVPKYPTPDPNYRILAHQRSRFTHYQMHHIQPNQPEDYQIQNQKSLLDTQMAAAKRLGFFLRWIAASALAVSGLGIVAITWIAVKERTHEIGTRRALGATATDIFFQVTCETAAVALGGGLVGIIVSWPASRLISDSVGLPFVFDRNSAVLAFGVAAALNLVFSFLPSRMPCLRKSYGGAQVRISVSVARDGTKTRLVGRQAWAASRMLL